MRTVDVLQHIEREAAPAAALPAERERERGFLVRAVAARRHPQKPLAAERLRRALEIVGGGDDGEIELIQIDPFQKIGRGLADHGELDTGISARIARHDFRQIPVGIVVGNAKTNAAGELGPGKGGQRLEIELHDSPRVFEQPLAVLGQLRGAPVAGENRLVQPLLQPLHLHGDRRLGLVNDIGGLGEAAGLGDRDKRAQLVDINQDGHLSAPDPRFPHA